jgi:hypothetical protein
MIFYVHYRFQIILTLSVSDQLLARILSKNTLNKGNGIFLSYVEIETLDEGKTWLVNGTDTSINNLNYTIATIEYIRQNIDFNDANVR